MLNVSFNSTAGSYDRAMSRGDPTLPMRVSPSAASPSVREALAPAPSLDNSGVSSAPGSLLPDLEAAGRVPLDRAPLMPALEAETFRMACIEAKINTMEYEGKCSPSTESKPIVLVNLTY